MPNEGPCRHQTKPFSAFMMTISFTTASSPEHTLAYFAHERVSVHGKSSVNGSNPAKLNDVRVWPRQVCALSAWNFRLFAVHSVPVYLPLPCLARSLPLLAHFQRRAFHVPETRILPSEAESNLEKINHIDSVPSIEDLIEDCVRKVSTISRRWSGIVVTCV